MDGGVCSFDIELHLMNRPFPLLLMRGSDKAEEKSFSMAPPLFSHPMVFMKSLYNWDLVMEFLSEEEII